MSGPRSVNSFVLVIGIAVLAAAPAVLSAQSRIELTPFVASYYGLTHLAEGSGGPFSGNDFTIDQDDAFAFGGRLSFPVGAQVAVEGEFTYALSGASITEKDGVAPGTDGGISQSGYLLLSSVRAVFSPRRSNLFLLAGPALITRGGDAWQGVDSGDITDFGGVLGIGVRANVTPKFRLNITAESYLYSFNGGGPDSKFQSDVLVSIGVPISLGGH